MTELVVVFLVVVVIYGAGWIWQTIHDVVRDIRRSDWDSRVYGQTATPRAVRRSLGGHDLAALRDVFRHFAELFDGRLHDRPSLESPKVSFAWKGARALLSIYEATESETRLYTQVTLAVPDGWGHRLEIFPQRLAGEDVRYLNVDDIRIGDAEFDPRYVVKSESADFARSFLDPKARQSVDDLRNLLGNDRILISLNASRLMVRKQDVLSKFEDLAVFAELSGRLFDRVVAFSQRESGIEIDDDAPSASAGEDPVCQVCGSRIPADVRVFCRKCRTPHHKECWEYNGKCSTFGCGEERFALKY
jgi:hypothetical protein